MGTISLRGRATPVDVFEPMPDAAPDAAFDARALAAELVAAHAAGDREGVLALTARIDRSADKDAALVNLAGRLAKLNAGESYVLG